MSAEPKPGVGLPFGGGVIVDTTGRKWGIVEMPDGRRVVRDVSAVIAAAPQNGAPLPTAPHRRRLGPATDDELAGDDGIEAFTQLLLDQLAEAHAAGHKVGRRRHTPVVPEEHDGTT